MKEKVKELLILILTAAFVLGFAVWRICKPDDASCGVGVEKLKKADYATLDAMYEDLKKKADLRLSMSPMTFPHH